MTIKIRPLRDDEVEQAKEVIFTVAYQLFAPDASEESFREVFLGHAEDLADMDSYSEVYSPPDGLFLAAVDNGRIIGTGAIKRFDDTTAELKRMWLLEAYQGQGIGLSVLEELLDFARANGYGSVYLTTSQMQQRAIRFYGLAGFSRVATREADLADFIVAMELTL